MVDFNASYTVSVSVVGRCEVGLARKMKEMLEFKHMRTVQCKHGEMEGKIKKKRVMKGKCVITSCAKIMRVRNVSMKRVMEQYSPANTNVWIRDLNME